ncbi:MAG TPA: hypothetical protein VF132_07995 [Rudaea sp.]
MNRCLRNCAAAMVLTFVTSTSFAYGPNPWAGSNLYSADPPGRVFPGKYFEYKAQFYLRKGDLSEALRLFELAGYWGNKVAQYNAGLMHYKGLGTPEDPILGTAWLGIAAERHDDLADAALQNAYASLSPAQRQQADVAFRNLDEKYGDRVSIPRAIRQYQSEARSVTGSHVGFAGNVMVTQAGSDRGNVMGTDFYSEQRRDLDQLIGRITGHVSVGAVEALPMKLPRDDAKK